jgi:NADH-quinone oxidoreductase subunit L
MAFALLVLAVGSVLAGYVGVPHAIGGSNRIEQFLEPSFVAHASPRPEESVANAAGRESAEAHQSTADEGTELTLMGISSLVALAGIGIAFFFFLANPAASQAMAERFAGVKTLLLNKYYVDEVYDATIIQPVKVVSTEGLWRGFDVKVIDGAVNGAGYVVSGVSIVLRLLQNGSVKTYAASMFVGAVAILAYYLWR